MYKILHIPTGNYVYFKITEHLPLTIHQFESKMLTLILDPRYLNPKNQLRNGKLVGSSYTFYRIVQSKYYLILKFHLWVLSKNSKTSNFFNEYSYKQFEIVED